jgi:hypothetical protein
MFRDRYEGNFDRLRTTIQRGDNYYVVSTSNTDDHGLETMIFLGDKEGNVKDYLELYVDHYSSPEEATAGHQRASTSWAGPNEG